MKTPYQAAQAAKLPYIHLKVDFRTAKKEDQQGGLCLESWGPCSLELADQVKELIAAIARGRSK